MNAKKKRNTSLKALHQKRTMWQMRGEGNAKESVKRVPRIAHVSGFR